MDSVAEQQIEELTVDDGVEETKLESMTPLPNTNNYTIDLYWMRHGESCANKQMVGDTRSILSIARNKFNYEPNLTHSGIQQAILSGHAISECITNINTNNPQFENYILFVSSAMTRTIMTGLFATRLINSQFPDIDYNIFIFPYISEHLSKINKIATDYQNSVVKSNTLVKKIRFIKDFMEKGFPSMYQDIDMLADFAKICDYSSLDANLIKILDTCQEIKHEIKITDSSDVIHDLQDNIKLKLTPEYNTKLLEILKKLLSSSGSIHSYEIYQFIYEVLDNTRWIPDTDNWFQTKYKYVRNIYNPTSPMNLSPDLLRGVDIDLTKYKEAEMYLNEDEMNRTDYYKFLLVLKRYLDSNQLYNLSPSGKPYKIHVFAFTHGKYIKKNILNISSSDESTVKKAKRYDELQGKNLQVFKLLKDHGGVSGRIPNTAIVLQKDVIIDSRYVDLTQTNLVKIDTNKLQIVYNPNLKPSGGFYRAFNIIFPLNTNVCRTENIKGFINEYLDDDYEPFLRGFLSRTKDYTKLDPQIKSLGFVNGNIRDDLTRNASYVNVVAGGYYEKKYLKYKQKYLELKKLKK